MNSGSNGIYVSRKELMRSIQRRETFVTVTRLFRADFYIPADLSAQYGDDYEMWMECLEEAKILQSENTSNVMVVIVCFPGDKDFHYRFHRACTLYTVKWGERVVTEAPYVRTSETSREAATLVKPRARHIRAQVLALLKEEALSDEEISQRLGIPLNTARPRRVELVQMNLVSKVGYTWSRSTNRRCNTWKAVTR